MINCSEILDLVKFAILAHNKWKAGPQVPALQEMLGFNLTCAHFERTNYSMFKKMVVQKTMGQNCT